MGKLDTALWAVKKIGYKLWDKRADIAFVAGIAGTAVGTYMFVKGSKKNEPVIEQYKKTKEEIVNSDMSEEDKKKAIRANAITAFIGSVRNYAGPVVVTSASYGAQIYSHVKLHSELDRVSTIANGLAASLALIQKRITDAEGEDKWREYAYGQSITQNEIVDAETGEVSKEKSIDVGNAVMEFSAPFTESFCDGEGVYDTFKGSNVNTLLILQSGWNDSLSRDKKIILLSAVWESIYHSLKRFPKEWAKAGWVPNKGTEPTTYISFGLDSKDAATVAFRNGETPDVRLVFNCVPDVYEAL